MPVPNATGLRFLGFLGASFIRTPRRQHVAAVFRLRDDFVSKKMLATPWWLSFFYAIICDKSIFAGAYRVKFQPDQDKEWGFCVCQTSARIAFCSSASFCSISQRAAMDPSAGQGALLSLWRTGSATTYRDGWLWWRSARTVLPWLCRCAAHGGKKWFDISVFAGQAVLAVTSLVKAMIMIFQAGMVLGLWIQWLQHPDYRHLPYQRLSTLLP